MYATQVLERGLGEVDLAGHPGGRGEHAVGPTKSKPAGESVARQPHRLVVIATEEFRVGGNAVVNCRERIRGLINSARRAASLPSFQRSHQQSTRPYMPSASGKLGLRRSAESNSAGESL